MGYIENPIDYLNIIKYTPWFKTQACVTEYIINNATLNSSVLDLMCGPGYLLNELSQKRKDLKLTGLDINSSFINYSIDNYNGISFIQKDVLKWSISKKYDFIICTGGFHHFSSTEQIVLISKILSTIKPDTIIIIGEPLIGSFKNENERKLRALDLGYQYIKETIYSNNYKAIFDTVEILKSDLLKSENKTSHESFALFISEYLSIIEVIKAWSYKDAEFGDYVFICKGLEK